MIESAMSVSSLRFLPGVRALILSGFFACHSVSAGVPQADYDAVIQATRGEQSSAQLAPAIDQLRAWHLANPEDMRFLYDLAALLDRAGDYPAALLHYPQIVKADAPPYAIKAVAHAAKMANRPQQAEAAYQLLVNKTPEDREAHVGLVYAWIEQKRLQQAFDYASRQLPDTIEKYSAADVPMMVALAELHELRKEWVQAAGVYQKVLQFNPAFRYAQRGRVFALSQAGMPYLAKRFADLEPGAFDNDEKYRLAHAAAALTIRFGEAQLAAEDKRSRITTIDIALAENADLTRQFGDMPQTKFDRMIALRDRGHMREAVQLYDSLVEANVAIPAYVKLAAADAYLYLEQPETARDLYLEGLQDDSAGDANELLNSRISLVYAYHEAEQQHEAEALADRLLREQPQRIYQGLRGLDAANPDYSQASVLGALLQLYGDRLAIAEKQLTVLRAQVPFNAEIRSAWASLQSAREHPRAALDEFSLLLIDQPKSVGAAVGRGETLLSLNEFAQAGIMLQPLPAEHPESKAVQHFARKLANYDRPFFKVETTIGQGATSNGADSVTDAALYSAPLTGSLGEHFRVFSHVTRADGETGSENVSRTRLGVGLDYRARDISVDAEINHTLGEPHASGVALALNWELSDAWRGQVALDTNINDLPVAALRSGVTAEGIKLGMTWTANESRKAGGELASTRFSDNNIRDMARIWWLERWISGPALKLESILGVSSSRNSQTGRNYFNPTRDVELGLETKGEWLTWRRYQRSFRQRVSLNVGQYWQSDFDRGATAGLRYEHEWRQDDALEFSYGVGRSFHPYDGNRDYRNYVYLNLSWRIQ